MAHDADATGKTRRLTFRDERIGELAVPPRGGRDGEWCWWQGRHVLDGQTIATRFGLSGSPKGPYAAIVAQVHRVLDHLEAITAKASLPLRERNSAASMQDFYLFRIGVWDEHDDILELELQPVDQPVLETDLTVYWPGEDELADHHIVFRARRFDYGES
jgi:hypothetical protein